MNLINLAKVLEQHKLWLQSKSGQRANLFGVDLRGVDLRFADLRGANLSSANLRKADLRGVDLRGVDLSSADLRDADLRKADLRKADLRGANLHIANLSRAKLSKAILSETPNPSPQKLLSHLENHVKTDQYDQANWCGTNCCLAGAAGQLIDNQSLGVALIMQVLPAFNIGALYQSDQSVAIAELERVAAVQQ